MRKSSQIIVGLLLVSSFAHASGIDRIGVKAGVNIANVYGEYTSFCTQIDVIPDTEPLYTFTAGGYLKYRFSDVFSLQPELLYSWKGFKYSTPATSELGEEIGENTLTHNYHFIDLPILAVFEFPLKSDLTPRVFAGQNFSCFLTGNYDFDSPLNEYDSKTKIKSDEMNRLEFGVVAGAGIDYGRFSFEARYYHALTKNMVYINYKNQVVSFMIGYSLFTNF